MRKDHSSRFDSHDRTARSAAGHFFESHLAKSRGHPRPGKDIGHRVLPRLDRIAFDDFRAALRGVDASSSVFRLTVVPAGPWFQVVLTGRTRAWGPQHIDNAPGFGPVGKVPVVPGWFNVIPPP
jgi:hypothetical protein